ncbi:MAG: thioredoxin domain-containing protein [Myxococcales bacterium]
MAVSQASSAPFGVRFEARVSRLVGSPLFWAALVLSIASYPVVHSIRAKLPPPPRVLGQMPDFSLTDQSGHAVGFHRGAAGSFDELNGKVWIAGFLSPEDPISAPFLDRLNKLQSHVENLGAEFALVSFCRGLAPADLMPLAKQHHNSPRLWKLLAGAPDPVHAAAVAGLHEALHGEPGGIDLEALDRGNTLILVDRQGRIRGYYDSSDEPTVKEMLRELGQIANHLG